ncbi:thyrotropin-releasing hormone receptor-like [Patiria miniata]|uniref:G-protein coupled receptors family 1 profile domain-containing protein n=1 Tax=Patiria miniata TaxID=46514 RepID=A0A913ZTZ0_PATMI|nr:thyrotropin-releasing hormone receptor-like [Patiria miniata]
MELLPDELMNYTELNESLSNSHCLNLSNERAARGILFNAAGSALIVGIMPFLTALGLSSNFAFLYVVYSRPKMRTVTNAYLANLAVADISFLISATIPAIVQYNASKIVFDQLAIGVTGCIIVNYVILIFFYASVFMVFLVSLERYGAICRPFHQRVVMGRARTTKLIIGAWTIAVIFSSLVIPSLASLKITCVTWPEGEEFQSYPSQFGVCVPLEDWVNYVSNGFKMVPFFTAMFSSGYIYTKIVIQLNKKIPGLAHRRRYNKAMSRVLRSRKQIAVMLIATGVIFFLCQAPAQITTLARIITDNPDIKPLLDDGQRGIVQWVSRVLLFINSAVNPIVYNVTNSKYRKAFVETYICKQRKKVSLQTISIKSLYIPNGGSTEFYRNNNLELNTL